MEGGTETSRDFSGATVKFEHYKCYKAQREDEEVVCVDNYNMLQCLVGMSNNFKIIREQTEGKTFEEIKKEADSWSINKEHEPDLLAKTRAIKEGKMEPVECPDSFTEKDFSQDSLDVLEAFD